MRDAFTELCWRHATPEPPHDDEACRGPGVCSFQDRTLTFVGGDNFPRVPDTLGNHTEGDPRYVIIRPGSVESLSVLGGNVYNYGEEALSAYVLANRETLRRLVYSPDRTNGGTFVRPYYRQGRRDVGAVFPALTHVTCNVQGLSVLLALYTAPRLESVTVVCKGPLEGVQSSDRTTMEVRIRGRFPTIQTIAFATRRHDEIVMEK